MLILLGGVCVYTLPVVYPRVIALFMHPSFFMSYSSQIWPCFRSRDNIVYLSLHHIIYYLTWMRFFCIEFILSKEGTDVLCSYVRGYGQRWLWGHHEHWYFISCYWHDEKKIWVHPSAKMYLIHKIMFSICIIFHHLIKP